MTEYFRDDHSVLVGGVEERGADNRPASVKNKKTTNHRLVTTMTVQTNITPVRTQIPRVKIPNSVPPMADNSVLFPDSITTSQEADKEKTFSWPLN